MRIRAIVAGLAAALAASHYAAAQDKIELKFSTFVPPTHWWYSEMLTAWAADMEKRTGGKVTVRLFAGNSPFGNVVNQTDQVARSRASQMRARSTRRWSSARSSSPNNRCCPL
jgi:TRAP-type C4-dicarboxylate transport system substrate-binding protein